METLELIKRARSGDKLAREQVIEENMGLVYSLSLIHHRETICGKRV